MNEEKKTKLTFIIIMCCIVMLWVMPNIRKKTCLFGHSWRNATCTTPKTCRRCGKHSGNPISENGEHTWIEATCTEPKTCSVCGETIGTASHDFQPKPTCTVEGICTKCGEKEIKPHTYSNGICIDCGAKKPKEYSYLNSSDDDYWYAVEAAKDIVKNKLKSPSTAKFPKDDYTVKHDYGDYVVIGYVDAQNGFGATVRTYWSASFTMGRPSGGKYKISNYSVTFY